MIGAGAVLSLVVAIALAVFVFWLSMLVICIEREPSEESRKLVWVLVIVLMGPLGALLYLFFGHPAYSESTSEMSNGSAGESGGSGESGITCAGCGAKLPPGTEWCPECNKE